MSAGVHPQGGVKSSVAQQFSDAAAGYIASPIHATGSDLQEMIVAADLKGDEHVLDAGCGPGHTALSFAPHVEQVVALDLSPAMLVQGQRLAGDRELNNVVFRQGDVEQLPFGEAEFDLVTTRYSAHHWPHPLAALAEFRRVLRPTGRLLLADVVSWEDDTVDTHFQTIELLRDRSHVRDRTAGQWLSMLRDTGFIAAVVYSWTIAIDFTTWVERIHTPPQQVAMLKTLLGAAPDEVRNALQIQPDGSFSMQCVLFSATPQPSET